MYFGFAIFNGDNNNLTILSICQLIIQRFIEINMSHTHTHKVCRAAYKNHSATIQLITSFQVRVMHSTPRHNFELCLVALCEIRPIKLGI